ncbi:iron-siderophore ABC transporter substrate-binding protein [Corynebacterium sp. CCM 9185]|uniref:Iron-siderophore ABC transporter substrate-binding protein n=1 Tax=Corynebacterium marambiense TaxID=2765364 RepID=A0ABS0VSU8_9CORY|nr:iron-siderophore ABC transporter substrate-binding protein [Corynebacterium marambiense]MBI8999848.1 iron-siderophore ABC transporter substrate-binding protein [Corynebacterium marambiense]MCK7662687.1 iron-siderophore ABC transporter substrate-binding protein [Corynebacterium marambiense]MCX7543698.1 iron-siderophore ABC transporter substrate-binding protein [Corynebacterium marambiense]
MKRRDFLRAAALACATALGLTACTGDGGTASQTTTETRTITDVQGTSVDVPVSPQRVVALSEPTLDGLLALGVTPAGAVAGRGQNDIAGYLRPMAEGVPLLGNVAQPNFEAIGAAKPDLILVDGTSINNNPPVIEALRAIAPVVYTGYAGGDWRINFRHIADAMNMSDAAEDVIADYDAHVAEVKAMLSDYRDSTFSIVRWQGNSAALILKELPAGTALEDLGLHRPPNQDRRGRGHSEPVSQENLRDIDADYIFFGTLGGSSVNNPSAGGAANLEEAQSALAQAEEVPGFTDLKAYRDGTIIPVAGDLWTSTGGPLLMNNIVDDVAQLAS